MKLLNCTECHDVVKLHYEPRRCGCGRSEGRYMRDGLWAQVAGPCRVLGLSNATYGAQPGERMECWVIDEARSDCHVKRV